MSHCINALIHFDICDPLLQTSLGGSSYFVTFIDGMRNKTWILFLKQKKKFCQISNLQKFG
jgi:hypothetical protein